MRRLERMISGSLASAEQVRADKSESAGRGAGDAGGPVQDAATARAEALVDGLGEQLGTLATTAGHRIRRGAALAREEAEDIWAEARQIHQARRRDSE